MAFEVKMHTNKKEAVTKWISFMHVTIIPLGFLSMIRRLEPVNLYFNKTDYKRMQSIARKVVTVNVPTCQLQK